MFLLTSVCNLFYCVSLHLRVSSSIFVSLYCRFAFFVLSCSWFCASHCWRSFIPIYIFSLSTILLPSYLLHYRRSCVFWMVCLLVSDLSWSCSCRLDVGIPLRIGCIVPQRWCPARSYPPSPLPQTLALISVSWRPHRPASRLSCLHLSGIRVTLTQY